MRIKQGTAGVFLYAPEEYVRMAQEQDTVDFSERDKYEFVHLFVQSQKDYFDRIQEALQKLSHTGTLWISYPKSGKGNNYDINRNIIFELTPQHGMTVCSNVALDETWSALRLKKQKNE